MEIGTNYGQEIIKITDESQKYAKFEVPENEIEYVKKNQNVKFKVYGHPTKSFYKDLEDILRTNLVRFFQLRLKKYSFNKTKTTMYIFWHYD